MRYWLSHSFGRPVVRSFSLSVSRSVSKSFVTCIHSFSVSFNPDIPSFVHLFTYSRIHYIRSLTSVMHSFTQSDSKESVRQSVTDSLTRSRSSHSGTMGHMLAHMQHVKRACMPTCISNYIWGDGNFTPLCSPQGLVCSRITAGIFRNKQCCFLEVPEAFQEITSTLFRNKDMKSCQASLSSAGTKRLLGCGSLPVYAFWHRLRRHTSMSVFVL